METHGMFDELWSMVRDGTLRLPIASVHALDEFADALKADATHGRNGKVTVDFRSSGIRDLWNGTTKG